MPKKEFDIELERPRGVGTQYLVVNKELREKAGINPGDRVHIIVDIDQEERVVRIPEDFQKVLNKNKKAKATFEKFSYTHKKEYVQWIENAKQEETRERRIQKAVSRLLEGIRTK
jgi:bifunctional DNA-binding transcriptional regulator/antitoxin component of YhaV-PrlF toxin-antitoxin module